MYCHNFTKISNRLLAKLSEHLPSVKLDLIFY